MAKVFRDYAEVNESMMEGFTVAKDTTMLKPSSRKVLIAMAEAGFEPVELAAEAGISKNIVYSMRRGFYTKPKYIGAVAKALKVKVIDLLEDVDNGTTE